MHFIGRLWFGFVQCHGVDHCVQELPEKKHVLAFQKRQPLQEDQYQNR